MRMEKKKVELIKRKNVETVKRTKIGVSINTELWRRLRALAIRQGELTGELLDDAIKEYLDSHEK
jgi:metal-responsive CopG/Arc/MetJ family transcriptional regulator